MNRPPTLLERVFQPQRRDITTEMTTFRRYSSSLTERGSWTRILWGSQQNCLSNRAEQAPDCPHSNCIKCYLYSYQPRTQQQSPNDQKDAPRCFRRPASAAHSSESNTLRFSQEVAQSPRGGPAEGCKVKTAETLGKAFTGKARAHSSAFHRSETLRRQLDAAKRLTRSQLIQFGVERCDK